MTYFTSDQHFGHFNIIRLCQRPFSSLGEMNETMLERWNAKVNADDTVYILGDLFFRCADAEPILKTLAGHKHLILGNHDHTWTKRVRLEDYFESIQTLKEINEEGRIMTLCHYPMLSYPQARRGYMVYGHIHNNVRDDYWPLIVRRRDSSTPGRMSTTSSLSPSKSWSRTTGASSRHTRPMQRSIRFRSSARTAEDCRVGTEAAV